MQYDHNLQYIDMISHILRIMYFMNLKYKNANKYKFNL